MYLWIRLQLVVVVFDVDLCTTGSVVVVVVAYHQPSLINHISCIVSAIPLYPNTTSPSFRPQQTHNPSPQPQTNNISPQPNIFLQFIQFFHPFHSSSIPPPIPIPTLLLFLEISILNSKTNASFSISLISSFLVRQLGHPLFLVPNFNPPHYK